MDIDRPGGRWWGRDTRTMNWKMSSRFWLPLGKKRNENQHPELCSMDQVYDEPLYGC